MSTYKITNITQLAPKRDAKYNSPIDVEYVDEMEKKVINIKPNETIYLTVSSLPLSVHRLRIKNLITVSEISTAELNKLLSDIKPKVISVDKKQVNVENKTQEKVQSGKKKLSKKEEDADI